jgi:hypothetical protein
MMTSMTLVAALMLIVAMGAGKFGLSAAGPQKATAETLKGLEGQFMKAAMERGSAGYIRSTPKTLSSCRTGPARSSERLASPKEWDFVTTRATGRRGLQ